MKRRIIIGLLFGFSILQAAFAQKEINQKAINRYSLKLYLPLSFYAGGYQFGEDTRGRWNSRGFELGLNMKNKRWEHEFILGSPSLRQTSQIASINSDSNGTVIAFEEEVYNTQTSLNYQGAYRVFTNRSKRLSIAMGLGFLASANFAKTFDYNANERYVDYRRRDFVLRPYLLSSCSYALSPRWSLDFTLMSGPYTWIYSTTKNVYPPSRTDVVHHKSQNDYSKYLVSSRIGLGYQF